MWPALNARTRAAPTSRWAVTRVTLSNESADSTASEVSAAFRAITLPLRALGLPLVPLTEPATASTRKICPLVGLVIFAYAVRLLVAFFAREHDLSSFRVLLALGHIFRSFTSFLSVVHFCLHYRLLNEVVTKIRAIFDAYSHIAKLARFIKLLSAFCVVCAFVLWPALLMNAFMQNKAYPYAHYDNGIRAVLVFIDTFLLSLSKTLSSFIIVLFVGLCYMLSNSTLRFMLTLESEFTNARAFEIKAVRKALLRLSRISDVANALNRTYGAILSWWYAEFTASFLLGVPSCIVAVSGGAQFSEYAFSLVDLLRDMTVFMTMTFVASEMAKNVSDSLHYALRVTNTIEDRNVDLNFALLLENLVCHIEDAKVELSGAEFFHVDRALINRVLLLVSTFAIILYQFLS
ncbi:hypothetical protein HPB52_000744 [Rhipicephalus sanguineus]|uniref:Uncharacterized protein n=1 Tax=Rhipicephalus sanguineus TaxID=34632 RepID=A0A9D4PHT9_RHISA|nr:hypothetical protein HPB52_000744 [Rhipicephalus sanguineus]